MHHINTIQSKPLPLSNELLIVTALGQWSPLQGRKIASLPETEALHLYMARRPFSKPIGAKEERSSLSSANQGFSTTKPRGSHAPCTHPLHKLTSHHMTSQAGVVRRIILYVSIVCNRLNIENVPHLVSQLCSAIPTTSCYIFSTV